MVAFGGAARLLSILLLAAHHEVALSQEPAADAMMSGAGEPGAEEMPLPDCSGGCSTEEQMQAVFAAWIEKLRAQSDRSWSKAFSREDGPVGCGGNSPGQGCKIGFESSDGRGITDGLCVATPAALECWAVLNPDHAPSDYMNPKPMQGMPLARSWSDESIVAWIEKLRAQSSQSWSKAFSREDGSVGCGSDSPGEPCKVNFCRGDGYSSARSDGRCVFSDGWCVGPPRAAGDCWALLNPAHEPRDYVKGPGVVIP